MAKEIDKERRRTERYGLRTIIRYESSTGLRSQENMDTGKTVNISTGGFCLRTNKPMVPFQIVRVRIPVSRVNVSSPTLAEVCWVEGMKSQKEFSVGLRFLI